ncbi:hypothetical protein J4220_03325 [Candidatus Micrarchaeota archaeon]|nr:hypothetical protein [Candidatus Micrarchaeota archaeon]
MPTEKLKPVFRFRRSFPYPEENYEVIRYVSFHPDLKRRVDEVKDQTRASRWATAFYLLLITPIGRIAQLPRVVRFLPESIVEAFPKVARMFPGWVRGYYSTRGVKRTSEGRLRIFMRGLGASLTNFAFPYLIPRMKTKALGVIVNNLYSSNRAPFIRRDWKRLIEEHDDGLIDDANNIVLLKHPDNPLAKQVSPEQRRRLLRAWNQHFQRTRFSLKGNNYNHASSQ